MSLLKMQNITKYFGASPALTDVSLELQAGEVLGLVGENGAGKSTLIKTLAGAHQPDAGSIEIDGQKIVMRSPSVSIAAGIAVIYQELTMIPELSVAENIFLGNVIRRGPTPLVNRSEMNRQATEILKILDLKIDPRTKVANLTPGYQQMIEIGRAINRNARLLVMDEPTSSLSETEVQLLYKLIERLKKQQMGIIYISHHLEEIFEVCDRVMVLRDGKTITERKIADWTSQSLVEVMVNRTIDQFYPYRPRALKEVTLTVQHLAAAPRLVDVSFEARKGEIVGIAGVVGSGRSELLKAIFGALPYQRGELSWLGQPFSPKSPWQSIQRGMVLVPEDRKKDGLMLDASIESNIAASMLKKLSRGGMVNFQRKKQLAQNGMKQFNVAAWSPQMPVRNLSGGNQQKVVFARTSATQPLLYLLDEPTRGVDVGAKVEVYKQIMNFAEHGCTILLVSSELPELLGLSDRVLVLNGGKIVADLSREKATHQQVLHLSTDERVAIGDQETLSNQAG